MIFFEKHNIQTRVIFTGNVTRQPAFKNIKQKHDKDGFLESNYVMENGMLIAGHHGLTDPMLDSIFKTFEKFIAQFSH